MAVVKQQGKTQQALLAGELEKRRLAGVASPHDRRAYGRINSSPLTPCSVALDIMVRRQPQQHSPCTCGVGDDDPDDLSAAFDARLPLAIILTDA